MADSIQFPRGNKATMPVLPDGAPGWCKDEKALYIGHPDGNQKVGDAAIFQRVTNLETAQKALAEAQTALETAQKNLADAQTDLAEAQRVLSETVSGHTNTLKTQGEELAKKLEANAVTAQATLADTADLAAVIGAFNSLISAMKTSKVMNE